MSRLSLSLLGSDFYPGLEKQKESEGESQQSEDQNEEIKSFFDLNLSETANLLQESNLLSKNKLLFNLAVTKNQKQMTPILGKKYFSLNQKYQSHTPLPLCCVKNFYQNQVVQVKNEEVFSLIGAQFPFSLENSHKIKRIICSMLNSDGGSILIVSEKNRDARIISPNIITEQQKQEVFKNFRFLTQKISPSIITGEKKYKVEFVPVKDYENGPYIPGGYVIRIKIDPGKRDEIYSYEDNGIDVFPFRSMNEIFQKKGRSLLNYHNQIIKCPLPKQTLLHQGVCEMPDFGELLHSIKKKSRKQTKKKKLNFCVESEICKKQIYPQTFSKQTQGPFRLSFSKKGNQIQQQLQVASQQVNSEKQQKRSFEIYYFAVGLDGKDLEPCLEKYQIKDIIIEKFEQKKIIIKIKQHELSKVEKLFERIEKKYKNRICFTKISLKIEVKENRKQILDCLQPLSSVFTIHRTCILKFNTILDSFKAFILASHFKSCISFIHS